MSSDFIKKVYFAPFSVYKWSIPVVFGNSVFVPKFISLILSSFFCYRKERGSSDFGEERESGCWSQFRPPKWLKLVNEFRLTRKVSPGFIFWFFELFFFLKSWIYLSRCFLEVWGENELKNEFLNKKTTPCFFGDLIAGFCTKQMTCRLSSYWKKIKASPLRN